MAEAEPTESLPAATPPAGALREVAALFLKLGLTAFGGPAAHIAMMRNEVVTRRHWLSDRQFLDLLGASNLIPGPTSTELAIYLGYARAGRRGLLLAGLLFILPATSIVLAFAWAYVRFGARPEAVWLLYGVKPVIIAIVVQALVGLTRTAVKGPVLAVVGLATLALSLLGVNPLVLLLAGGAIVLLVRGAAIWRASGIASLAAPALWLAALGARLTATETPRGLLPLFLTFLKIGAVLYGSGYVLLVFLRADFVERLHWLTEQQLLDAVAVGRFTPGPVFTTATFIGYLVAGVPGALVATVAIFLPSFFFVALHYPFVPRLRRSPWMSALLDGVTVASLGLMAAVSWSLTRAAIVDWRTAALAVVAAVLAIRWKVNSAWLVIGGGAAGIAYHAWSG